MCSDGTKTIRVATDVGGTFTDLVCFETDLTTGKSTIRTAKSDTTPPDFEKGVLGMFWKGGVGPTTVDFLAHGTTVVINALTERTGRQGRTDHHRRLPRYAGGLRRGNRPSFFNLHYRKPVRSCHVTCAANCPDARDLQVSSAKRSTLGALPGDPE